MKIELLANTVEHGAVTDRQHYTCFIVDGKVAIDAGSLASGSGPEIKDSVRSVVLSHAHLDHIAGLPLFIDDLFDKLREPVTIYALPEVIEILKGDVFNWRVYPDFSELTNRFGPVMEYLEIVPGTPFRVEHLVFEAVEVNHKVPSLGFIVSDGKSVIAMSGDTAEMEGFWERVNMLEELHSLLIECAFPDRMSELAEVSHHLTPSILKGELAKFTQEGCRVYAVNLKPMYRKETVEELDRIGIAGLEVFPVGRTVEF